MIEPLYSDFGIIATNFEGARKFRKLIIVIQLSVLITRPISYLDPKSSPL